MNIKSRIKPLSLEETRNSTKTINSKIRTSKINNSKISHSTKINIKNNFSKRNELCIKLNLIKFKNHIITNLDLKIYN